jgi:hypothetical protein
MDTSNPAAPRPGAVRLFSNSACLGGQLRHAARKKFSMTTGAPVTKPAYATKIVT